MAFAIAETMQLRLLALVTACACGKGQPPDLVPSHVLGESTASGPSDPTAPPPDAMGAVIVSSGPIRALQPATPAPAGDGGGGGGGGGVAPAPVPAVPSPDPQAGGVIVGTPAVPVARDAGVAGPDAGASPPRDAGSTFSPDAGSVTDAGSR